MFVITYGTYFKVDLTAVSIHIYILLQDNIIYGFVTMFVNKKILILQ